MKSRFEYLNTNFLLIFTISFLWIRSDTVWSCRAASVGAWFFNMKQVNYFRQTINIITDFSIGLIKKLCSNLLTGSVFLSFFWSGLNPCKAEQPLYKDRGAKFFLGGLKFQSSVVTIVGLKKVFNRNVYLDFEYISWKFLFPSITYQTMN